MLFGFLQPAYLSTDSFKNPWHFEQRYSGEGGATIAAAAFAIAGAVRILKTKNPF